VHRPVRIVIPFKLEGAKSRLSPALSPEERQHLALAMLSDVLDAASGFGRVTMLARPGHNRQLLRDGLDIVECSLDLNDAINELIDDWQKQGWQSDLMIVMADLDLLCRDDVRGVLGTKGDVVLSPGRGGGTNMILIRDPRFRTCYQGQSFIKHRDLAGKLGLNLGIYASYRSGCDIDEPDDLVEVLIHGSGRALELLRKLGFELSPRCRSGCIRAGQD
jgi:2-phospho-L-lactate/phosphoenolpyruvate guanylyltransferase